MGQPRRVYITGHGHSGSTLLDILPGSHSRVVALGEIEHLSPWGASPDPHRACSCGAAIADCSYWSSVTRVIQHEARDQVSDADGRDFWRGFGTAHQRVLEIGGDRFVIALAEVPAAIQRPR
jgi:hypothetical protein